MSEKYFGNNKVLFDYNMGWQFSSKKLAFHVHLCNMPGTALPN